MTTPDAPSAGPIRRLLRRMPKWASDVLFAFALIAVYLVASLFVLPRLGFET